MATPNDSERTDAVSLSLARAAATYALQGAANLFSARKKTCPDGKENALAEAIKAELNTAIPAAMNDAEEAVKAGMPAVAVQTFAASMRLAGIRAAKKVLGEE